MKDKPDKFPSQHEAQLVIDTLEALDRISISGASESHTVTLINNMRVDLQVEFIRIFGSPETSPWCIEIKRGAHGIRRILKMREDW